MWRTTLNFTAIAGELDRLADVRNRLHELDVIRSEKLLADLGEWFVEVICKGKRSSNKTEKGWDVEADDRKIQVKTVTAPKPSIKTFEYLCKPKHEFDDLAIVVLNDTYRLAEPDCRVKAATPNYLRAERSSLGRTEVDGGTRPVAIVDRLLRTRTVNRMLITTNSGQ